MNRPEQKKSVVENLRQMYALPKWNSNFSLSKSLPLALGLGLAYGFISYWLSKFLGGTEDTNRAIGIVGIFAGTISTLISDRWKIGWALDELVGPILTFAVFMVAWYVLN